MTVVSMHTFFNAIFGIDGFSRFYRMLPPFAYGLGLIALAFFLFVAVRDRVLPLLILFYLSALSIALSFLFPLNDLRIWLHPQAGPRYFLFACVFIHFAILHLAFATRSFRDIGFFFWRRRLPSGSPPIFSIPGNPMSAGPTRRQSSGPCRPAPISPSPSCPCITARWFCANIAAAREVPALRASTCRDPDASRFFRQPSVEGRPSRRSTTAS